MDEYSYNEDNGFVAEISESLYEDGSWFFDNKEIFFYDDGNCTEHRTTDQNGNIVERSLFEYNTNLLADGLLPYTPEVVRPTTFNNTNLYTLEHWYALDVEHVLQYVCDYIYKYVDITEHPTESVASMNVYPNPTSDFINIEKGGRITIYDINGRIVLSAHSDSEQINVSNLPSGNYIINVTNELGSNNAKFTISR